MRQTQGMRGESGVVGARQQKHRAGDLGDGVPKRLLGSGPTESQARSQAGCVVAQALTTVRFVTQSLEERPAQPRFEEPLNVARGLEPVCQCLVRPSPRGPFRRVLDPACRTDQDGAAYGQLGLRENVQREASAEGVPDERARLVPNGSGHRFGHEAGTRREVSPDLVGAAVPREVDRDKGERLRQFVAEASPEPSRLCEAVQQGYWRSRTSELEVKGHVG